MKFYNREKEIAKLLAIKQQSINAGQFTVVTGRRRIGKTQLLLKAYENESFLYFFVSRKSEVLLCKDYQNEIVEKLGLPILGEVTQFVTLFEYILQQSIQQPITLIIDEFQEFFMVNSSVYSDMQRLWDLYQYKSKINLLVSGSVESLMHKIFENNKEPLFGRAQHYIKVKPFETKVLKQIIKEYHPNFQPDDLLALYSFTGGVAKYVQLLMDNGAYTKNQMLEYILAEDSIFINEGKNILIEEFGKEYGIYFSILSAIAQGHTSRNEIEQMLQKEIGGYVNKMERDYHLLKKSKAMFSLSESKNIKYNMQDNFLIFWFRFIYKYNHIVEIGAFSQLRTIVERDYATFSGMMLEKYFRNQAIESGNYTQVGNYWDRKGTIEIDYIAVNEIEKSIIFAEVKRNPDKIKLEKLKEKANAVIKMYGHLQEFECEYIALSLNDVMSTI
jgi:AAA+ ATPase superfamily predicted ATPase